MYCGIDGNFHQICGPPTPICLPESGGWPQNGYFASQLIQFEPPFCSIYQFLTSVFGQKCRLFTDLPIHTHTLQKIEVSVLCNLTVRGTTYADQCRVPSPEEILQKGNEFPSLRATCECRAFCFIQSSLYWVSNDATAKCVRIKWRVVS